MKYCKMPQEAMSISEKRKFRNQEEKVIQKIAGSFFLD